MTQEFTSLLPWKANPTCSPGRQLVEDEGELVFFVGEGKYRVTFKYETVPSRVAPIPGTRGVQ